MRLIYLVGILVTAAWLPANACGQTIFSPSQADLLGLEFADFMPNQEDEAALQNLEAVDADGAALTFKTDLHIADDIWRVAMEGPITADLTGLNAFSLNFGDPVILPEGISGIRAQLFVRSSDGAGGTVFTGNGSSVNLGGTPSTLSITPSAITSLGGDPSQISAFGVEFFGGDQFLGGLDGAMVTLRTSPEPPTLVDSLLFSWENGADLQGWDSQPIVSDVHTHVVRQGSPGLPAVGATAGVNALQVNRSPTTNTFEWGTAFALTASGGAVTGDYSDNGTVDAADYTVWRDNLGTDFQLPNRDENNAGNVNETDYDAWKSNFGTSQADDPIQEEIDDIVAMLNDPDAYSIAFDVTVEDQFPDSNPSFFIVHLAINTDGGPTNAGDPFFQNDNGEIPFTAIGSGEPVTVEMLLSQFVDVGGESDTNGQTLTDVGIFEDTGFLNIHLASNPSIIPNGEDFEFTIDNFRIRRIVPEEASLQPSSVPEPEACFLLLFAALCLVTQRCCPALGRSRAAGGR